MSMSLGTYDDIFFLFEEVDYRKLAAIASELNAGSDAMRDLGHRLTLVLENASSYKGYDLYTT